MDKLTMQELDKSKSYEDIEEHNHSRMFSHTPSQ